MSKKMSRDEFILKSKLVHGDLYDYSKVEYVNNKTKVCIIDPIHGEFWQSPSKHLSSKFGNIKRTTKVKHTKFTFIEKAKAIHGTLYDYSKVVYINNSKKVCIIDPIHGEFWQTPTNHLAGKGSSIRANNNTSSTAEFIAKSKELFGSFYNYDKVVYKNNREKICLGDPIYGYFYISPKNHFNGRKHPSRSKTGYDKNKKGFFIH